MKKIISILLAAVMVMALLAGCGSKNKDHTNDNNTPNNNQTTELSGSVPPTAPPPWTRSSALCGSSS